MILSQNDFQVVIGLAFFKFTNYEFGRKVVDWLVD